jgi:hypothetical protein
METKISREVLDDIIDRLKVAEVQDISAILEDIMNYGFADDLILADTLELEAFQLDELVNDSSDLTGPEFKRQRRALLKFLKLERQSYETLYYSEDKVR